MNVADIITEFGAYYINQGQNAARIVEILNQKFGTEDAFTSVVTDDTVWRGAQSDIGELLQPFQKAWTPKGEVGFTPIEIKQYPFKVDFEDYPDDLEATWLGFLADGALDRREWPFVRWVIEMKILPQIKEDLELKAIYNGEYAAPTPGTAGSAVAAMNGAKLIINQHILDGRITPIPTGTLSTTPATFVGQIETFADAINTRYWNAPMDLNMSQTNARRFFRGQRALYGKDTDFDGVRMLVQGTNISVVGRASMAGSNKIWATPKKNAILLKKKTQNVNRVQVENVDRQLKVYTDFYKGAGFLIPELVFTNELEVPDPD
jgi:hypothetical protein